MYSDVAVQLACHRAVTIREPSSVTKKATDISCANYSTAASDKRKHIASDFSVIDCANEALCPEVGVKLPRQRTLNHTRATFFYNKRLATQNKYNLGT